MSRFVFLLAILQLMAAEHREWRTAVLSETHRTKTYEGNVERTWQVYTLDLGDRLIICSEQLVFRNKPIDIAVGSEVRFSRSGPSILILGAKAKEYKLQIQQETMKAVDHAK